MLDLAAERSRSDQTTKKENVLDVSSEAQTYQINVYSDDGNMASDRSAGALQKEL